MDRRSFLATLSGALALQTLRSLHIDAQTVAFKSDPFTLGIASGEPAADSVILWTRLAPDLMSKDYGLSKKPVEVLWEIAEDSAMTKMVGKGTVAATPEMGHSVHVEAQGLKPGREYFYRFHSGGATSAVGRTKTAPAMDSGMDKVRFAFASCQSYGAGYYTAYRDMVKQDVDLVLFLGDYIYEHKPGKDAVRTWDFASSRTVVTLEDYRRQYAQYKNDPELQAAHLIAPWVVTPDDHEVENNWAGDHSEHEDQKALFVRRTAAYQAYYENQPLRRLSIPQGSHMQLYRNIPYGKLAQFTILDTRQFRTPQPCGDKRVVNCQERLAETQEIMGKQQQAWLEQSLVKSPAQWNIIAHQTVIGQRAGITPEGPVFSNDSWDGYAAARARMTASLARSKPRNPVFVAGDIHSTCVADVKADYFNPKSEIVASEIVGTSISSSGDGSDRGAEKTVLANPHIVYENHRRGYFLCDVDAKRMHSDLRTVDMVSDRNGRISKKASFVVQNDKKGIRQA